jgi:hypothetical protein
MKKIIIASAIILSSVIVALSINKKVNDSKDTEVKVDITSFTSKAMQGYGGFKSNIANAD